MVEKMGPRSTSTNRIVRILLLRRKSGGKWLSFSNLKRLFKGQYVLLPQSMRRYMDAQKVL